VRTAGRDKRKDVNGIILGKSCGPWLIGWGQEREREREGERGRERESERKREREREGSLTSKDKGIRLNLVLHSCTIKHANIITAINAV